MSPHPTRTAVVLLAGGSGSRMGAETNKVLLPLAGEPVLAWSLRTVRSLPDVVAVVVVHRPEDRDQVLALAGGATLVEGGPTRHASEWNALQALADLVDTREVEVVAIHDTARPLASRELFVEVIETAAQHGGALPVRPCPGLLPATPGASQARGDLVAVQTPQAFRARPLLDAYRAADRDGFEGTDTAACVERYAEVELRGVRSDATNLKITYPGDLAVADRLRRGA